MSGFRRSGHIYKLLFLYVVILANNVVMILKENILLPMDQQDQLIITFQEHITYSTNHQIIFHTKFAVLILILHIVHNIMKEDQSQKIMALFALVQNLTKVCTYVCEW